MRSGTRLKLEACSCLHTPLGIGALADSIPLMLVRNDATALQLGNHVHCCDEQFPTPLLLPPQVLQLASSKQLLSPPLPYLTPASHTPSCRCPGQVRAVRSIVQPYLTYTYARSCLLAFRTPFVHAHA